MAVSRMEFSTIVLENVVVNMERLLHSWIVGSVGHVGHVGQSTRNELRFFKWTSIAFRIFSSCPLKLASLNWHVVIDVKLEL